MTVPITTATEFDTSVLRCPRCGDEYLHHGRVDVYVRTEDAETGLHTTTGGPSTVVDRNMHGNPSLRRHGLTIAFSCEQCGDDAPELSLTIAQAKGRTFLAWREPA